MSKNIKKWDERLNNEGLYDNGKNLFGGWSAVTMARDDEIAELRAELEARTPAATDIPVPLTADMAHGMVCLGMAYLKECAPERLRTPAAPVVAEGLTKPTAYICPAGCGCMWRDNGDGTMSLFDGHQKSCAVCEPMPLAKLDPMRITDHLFIDARQDGCWHVCVEQVYKTVEEARASCQRWIKATAAHPVAGSPAEAHPDDVAVDRFAAAMKEKMAKSRAQGRWGWNDSSVCPAHHLRTLLCNHVGKGDPVDVGNFAMMLFNRGERTAAAGPMPASEAPIGAGDPMAFFADFCDREGYPSDGEMDAALKGVFYEGIRYCAVHTPIAAPVPASEAEKCEHFYSFNLCLKCGHNRGLAAPAAPTDALPYNWKPAPYEATEAMVAAAKQQDPALTVADVRALWSSMWKAVAAAPTDAKADAVVAGGLLQPLYCWESVKENSRDAGRVVRAAGGFLASTYLPEEAKYIADALNFATTNPTAAPSVRDAAQPSTQACFVCNGGGYRERHAGAGNYLCGQCQGTGIMPVIAAQPIAPEDTSAGDKIRLIREAENFVPPSDAMDARRYRFVREHGYVELGCKSPRADGWSPSKLDSAIDSAIAATATIAPGKDKP